MEPRDREGTGLGTTPGSSWAWKPNPNSNPSQPPCALWPELGLSPATRPRPEVSPPHQQPQLGEPLAGGDLAEQPAAGPRPPGGHRTPLPPGTLPAGERLSRRPEGRPRGTSSRAQHGDPLPSWAGLGWLHPPRTAPPTQATSTYLEQPRPLEPTQLTWAAPTHSGQPRPPSQAPPTRASSA